MTLSDVAPSQVDPKSNRPESILSNGTTEKVVVPFEEILGCSLFSDVPEKIVKSTLQRFRKNWDQAPPIWLRRFKSRETICEEGDFDQTAFFILEGSVEIYIRAVMGNLRSKEKKGGGFWKAFKRYTTSLVLTGLNDEDTQTSRKMIPIDAPIDLNATHPRAVLGPGDLFGEQTCISYYPRSATVKAVGPVVVYEMLAPVLQMIQEHSKKWAQKYRERALQDHIRNVPLFMGRFAEVYDFLKDRVELIRKFKGETIFREGDESDGFFMIRYGFVKVSQMRPGGETVLRYLGRGEYFGEFGLIDDSPRSASCSALGTVELVRVSKADFLELLDTIPDVRGQLSQRTNKFQQFNIHMTARTNTFAIRDFLDQGLMEAQNLLLLDLESCTRCDECVKACADAHDGVTRLNRVGLRFEKYLVATSCRSCADPVCMPVCPVGSIRRRDSMEIVIEDWCIGCTKCAEACPYGNINMHEFEEPAAEEAKEEKGEAAKPKARLSKKAITCDLCADVGGEPMCVYSCPHDAAHRVQKVDFPKFFPTVFGEGAVTKAQKPEQKSTTKT